MMKTLLFFLILMAAVVPYTIAQELVVGGGMEAVDEGEWTVFWSSDLAAPNDVTFGYTDDGPAAGQGGCLSVQYGGTTRIQIYQPVTLQVGHSYQLTGAFKNISAVAANANWLELILAKTEPNVNGDWGARNGDYFYQFHSWKGYPYQNIDSADGTFQNLLPLEWIGVGILSSPLIDTVPPGGDTLVFTIADTVTDLNWYVVIKIGCWHASGPGAEPGAFTLLFDSISLWDLAEPLPPSEHCVNLFQNSDMEEQGAWEVLSLQNDGGDINITFGSSTLGPSGASGACMEADYHSLNGTGQVFVYQLLTLIGGRTYKFRGFFKDNSVLLENTWVECLWIDPNKLPAENGGDITGNKFSGINVWNGCGPLDDGNIVDSACVGTPDSTVNGFAYFTIPDSLADTSILDKPDTLAVGFTIGMWTDVERSFNLLFDDFYISDIIACDPLDNAYLADLRIDGTTISNFHPQTFEYTYYLPYGETTIPTVTCTTQDPGATYEIYDAASVGDTTFISVHSEDSSVTNIYGVIFATGLPSSIATLDDIQAGGTSIPGFEKDSLGCYIIYLPIGTTEPPTVTCIPTDPHSSYEIIPGDSLNDRTYIIVTAENGITSLTYCIEFMIADYISPSLSNVARFFPSYVRDKFYVEVKDNSIMGGTIGIYDITGMEIFVQKVDKNFITIDCTKLSSGLYFVTLCKNDLRFTRKIIKE